MGCAGRGAAGERRLDSGGGARYTTVTQMRFYGTLFGGKISRLGWDISFGPAATIGYDGATWLRTEHNRTWYGPLSSTAPWRKWNGGRRSSS